MDRLAMLKRDLQIINNVQDEYLQDLLDSANLFIQREGIVPDASLEYTMIQVQYAGYLFRSRASKNTEMPRFLRYQLNNLLMHQKATS